MFIQSRVLRPLRRFFSLEPTSPTTIFTYNTEVYYKSIRLLPMIYILLSYFAFLQVRHREYLLDSAIGPGLFFYIPYLNELTYIILRWLPAPLLLIAAYFPKNKWLSLVALFSFIQQGALVNAIDVNENQYRPAIWLAIALLFLPTISSAKKVTRLEQNRFMSHLWFSLLFFSFAYYMAGFWKVVWGCIYQLFTDNLGFWNIQSMTYVITEYLLRTGTYGLYPGAEWIASYPIIGWALILAGTYAEATIWIVFFRPSLWRLYGTLMLCLHMGSKIILNIGFEAQYIMTGLLFFFSPFMVEKRFYETLADLPGFCLLLRFANKHPVQKINS
jgi:hypothetical protein